MATVRAHCTMAAMTKHVVIIGGGAIGSAVARYLTREFISIISGVFG